MKQVLAALINAAPATMNLPSAAGFTPLRVAAGGGSPAAVCFLLNAGADPSIGRPTEAGLVYLAPKMMRHSDGTDVVDPVLDMGSDRVQWARAQANAQRWEEEVEWLKVEIQRARKYFHFYADIWSHMVCLEPRTRIDVGGNAFCRKKSAMFMRLARQLDNIKLIWASKSLGESRPYW
ncbi:hypothetical protein BOTBODRAFT_49597 [Botryobasidium botryosum FD-172 SS1]|uniref:Uncharacterized protein n=1 Tax=Botryobasidium botryosum (strain FD-172 SS1) TaxID=930990 RepID=A0A067LUU5_BOTB1|nr:hypothetical protein BOTBODRAFT_49597 [Botryobasidium botryosum FD-172 SS1]